MKVLVSTIPFGEINPQPIESLRDIGAEVTINPLGRKLKDVDLMKLIPDFDVLIAGTELINRKVLEKAKRLKLIARVGIGLDNVDLIMARERGIMVTYTPDAPSPAVAELTIGLMIDLLRSVHVSNVRMHQGRWYRYFGQRLSEVSIGVIGSGRIGSRVIKHLAGFDCRRILVNDIDQEIVLPSHPTCAVEFSDKDRLFAESDIISLHIPLTAKTRNLIGIEQFRMMRSGTFLVNTSRGGIVNESDLFDVLQSGHLKGAAIDVFEEEPYQGRLSELDQCILTGHMGSMSVDCRTRMEIEAVEELVQFHHGLAQNNLVPEQEYENQKDSR